MGNASARVSTKGQLVIPAAIREKFGIVEGTRVVFLEDGLRLVLEPETVQSKLKKIHEMRGCTARGASMTDALIEERRRDRERELSEEGW